MKCHRDLQARNGVPTGRNAHDTKTVHKCFHNKCRTCGEVVSGKHRSYIRALRPQYGKTKERYVDGRGEFYFFDKETCIVHKEDGTKVFEVNVVCVMDESGEKKWRFKGVRVLDAFCSWIFLVEDSLLHMVRETGTIFCTFLLVRLISVLRIFCFLTVNFMALFLALFSMVTW